MAEIRHFWCYLTYCPTVYKVLTDSTPKRGIHMGVILTGLPERRNRLRADQALKLRQALLPFAEEFPDQVRGLIRQIDRQTASRNRWTFMLMSPGMNAAVVRYLLKNSDQPMKAVELWSICYENLCRETGEIMLSREEMAKRIDVVPNKVSTIMNELARINAILPRREKTPGVRGLGIVRYYMSPHVATHLPGAERDLAQFEAPEIDFSPKSKKQPKLRLVEAAD